ncbi:putative HTH-type transcriptional regulator Rv2887 [Microbacterium sp. Bi128]|nr:putative HTH-type transcriptional regulator Rv2887 [Microbacterium sp. Bi128]
MNVLLQTLERDGIVERAETAPSGKALPTRLTAQGRNDLARASAAVRGVERRMLGGMTDAEQLAARTALRSMVRSLRE